MQKCIVGKKIGMTQIFDEAGKFVPVTVVEAGPCVVVQKKTVENDGYESIQVGFGDIAQKKVSKPLQGHFAKADVACKRVLGEFRLDDCSGVNVGEIIKADTFEVGDRVDACGTSKGKGTQGEIKRHGHRRGPMTHGSKHKRLPGGKAGASYPGRVFKGNKESGRMGRDTVTVQNVVLVKVIEDRNLMLIKGAVPGNKGGLVRIQSAVKGQDK
mgnify:CR=1 FL=1